MSNVTNTQRTYTVSELNHSLTRLLEQRFSFIQVRGELSNVRQPGSGHIYFTLKDHNAQLRGVLFKMQQRYLRAQPEDGKHVICTGRLTVYEPRGEYQLIVDTMENQGEGSLHEAFLQLKNRLATEGLFDEHLKKTLPAAPRHITLVTSAQGAAVQDVIRIAEKRSPQTSLAIYPVMVQGSAAPREIADAIAHINRAMQGRTDLILLCRGGGSLEDLWAFNTEELARAIFASKLPVVSAVGHETDTTIADFAADLRAPTPSGAAEYILPDTATLQQHNILLRQRLIRAMKARIIGLEDRLSIAHQRLARHSQTQQVIQAQLHIHTLLQRLERAMQKHYLEAKEQVTHQQRRLEHEHPRHGLHLHRQQVADLQARLQKSISALMEHKEQEVQQQAALLSLVSPLKTMDRGYALARKVKKNSKTTQVLTRYDQVQAGERIQVLLSTGQIHCTVDAVEEDNELRPSNPANSPSSV